MSLKSGSRIFNLKTNKYSKRVREKKRRKEKTGMSKRTFNK